MRLTEVHFSLKRWQIRIMQRVMISIYTPDITPLQLYALIHKAASIMICLCLNFNRILECRYLVFEVKHCANDWWIGSAMIFLITFHFLSVKMSRILRIFSYMSNRFYFMKLLVLCMLYKHVHVSRK